MPKDFLQGASLKPTFIQHFKCGELQIFHIRFNIVKKHPPQNRTNVQIKGGGVKGLLNNVKKKLHFSERRASLTLLQPGMPFFCHISSFLIISRHVVCELISSSQTRWTTRAITLPANLQQCHPTKDPLRHTSPTRAWEPGLLQRSSSLAARTTSKSTFLHVSLFILFTILSPGSGQSLSCQYRSRLRQPQRTVPPQARPAAPP